MMSDAVDGHKVDSVTHTDLHPPVNDAVDGHKVDGVTHVFTCE